MACAVSAAFCGVLVGASAQQAELKSLTATLYPEGVVIEWRVSQTPDNAGFHVYRGDARITPDLVAGWAWSARGFTPDRRYAWLDPEGSGLDTYRVVAVDASGKETAYGPVGVEPATHALSARKLAVLLSELGLSSGQTAWTPAPVEEGAALNASGPRGMSNLLATGWFSVPFSTAFARPFQAAAAPQEGAWLLAEQSAIKLAVREAGWYRIGQPELVAAGLSRRVRPSSLRLYAEGEEVPLRVATGSGAGWGAGYEIEFYATPLDTPWSKTKVYWLVESRREGARIDKIWRLPDEPSHAVSYPCTVEFAERSVYLSSLRNGDAENFFGPVVNARGLDVFLDVVHLDAASQEDVALKVALQGAYAVPHDVLVQFNGADVGHIVFEGITSSETVFTVPPASVLEGENQVRLVAQSQGLDVSLVKSVSLTYAHLYRAEGNQLRCTVTGRELVAVTGFATSDVRAVDITDPAAPIEVRCKTRRQDGSFTAFFGAFAAGERKMLVFADDAVKAPVAVTRNVPSHLKSTTAGADFVIIAHADFAASVAPLAALRRGQGWTVAVVDVEDVFDEFNYGHSSPYAVKAFLSLAVQHWSPAPTHVLLCGDASYDPCNYLGFGHLDFVPTKLVDAVSMETASDDWYSDLNDDGEPELAIGRIPVRTSAEADAVVGKLVARENVLQTNSVIAYADAPMGGVDFSAANATLAALIPSPYAVHPIVRVPGDESARTELLARWSEGPRFVNYYGGASVTYWRGNTLTAADVPDFGNGDALPVVASICNLNCLFHDLYTEALGETLLKTAGGGAAAVWGCSDFVDPATLGPMNEEFVRRLFDGGGLTVGQASMLAKVQIANVEARRSWLLLGDPTMRP